MKTVLVTGAAGGIGTSTVHLLSSRGFRVIATDLMPGSFSDTPPDNQNIIEIPCDLRDQNSIAALRQSIENKNLNIDVLIHCAGIYEVFPVTEAPPDLYKKTMEVNFLSQQALISSFLDHLLKVKGRVITVSSESFRLPALFQPYMISKAALEAFAVTARQEMMLKGMKLIVVRPGAVKTPLLKWTEGIDNPVVNSIYQDEFIRSYEASLRMVGSPTHPVKVAELIYKAATVKYPRRVYNVNNSLRLRLLSMLPAGLREAAIKRLLSK